MGTPGKNTRRKSLHILLALAGQSAVCGVVHAQVLDYTIGLSLLHSDNINLSEGAPESDNVLSPQFAFTAKHAGSRLQLDASGSIQYLDFLGNTFKDQPRGQLTGKLDWTVSPERLHFYVQDYLSRQPVSVLNSFTPGNEQQINVFVAGPSLTARLGATTSARFDVRYTNSYAQDTKDFNGNRYSAAARLIHALNPTDELTLTAEGTRADFDNNQDTVGYTRKDAYIGYTSKLASLDLAIDAGYSWVTPNATDRTTGGILLRGHADWRATSRSSLILDASRQFADATSDLIARPRDVEIPVISDSSAASTLIGPGLYRENFYQLGYVFRDVRWSAEVHPYYQRIRYQDNVQPDQTNRGGYVQASYRLRSDTTLDLAASRSIRRFPDLLREDRDTIADLGLAHDFSSHWAGRIDLQRRQRSSTDAGQSYHENAVIVSFSYRR